MLPEIPIRIIIIGSMLTLVLLTMIGEIGFYIVALFIEDRAKVNEVRKLYRIALYILTLITFIVVII